MKEVARYLNTDLDLIAEQDLTLLVQALETSGFYTLHAGVGDDGKWYATLEINEVADEALHLRQPELTIVLMLDAIEALDAPARALWDACMSKTLDIGYQCGDGARVRNELTNATLSRMSALGMGMFITLYPCDIDN
ncbi:hypothetical protein [Thiothrix fructosivorans]|uniref:Uncharacterized protein n=1 Tax=Thiothrix fructosivorans TaxID=111770 RepID=A0A8B0SI02_9GAMM|nr:hypothetical protein [Thiothrix fructosivorans]MBO0612742.1 hypothetical protein [Thiothrix fructosivorans]QTX11793.1 hypothetical protein J1836_005470 [Thiothrix fructosivorans]